MLSNKLESDCKERGNTHPYIPVLKPRRTGIGKIYGGFRSSKLNWAPCAQLYTANERSHPPHSVSFSLIYPSYNRAQLVSPNRQISLRPPPYRADRHWLRIYGTGRYILNTNKKTSSSPTPTSPKLTSANAHAEPDYDNLGAFLSEISLRLGLYLP